MLDRDSLDRQLRLNRRDTGLVLGAIAALTALAGWLVAGEAGMAFALGGAALVLAVNPANSVAMLRAVHRAVPLPPEAAPGLWRVHVELCRRAGLETVPPLLYIPAGGVQALSTGWGRHCAVALSEGAITAFSPRETVAVLAHEIAHIRAGDLKLLRLADAAGHLTHALSLAALLMIGLYLPDIMAGEALPQPAAILAVILAPLGCDLLRMRLSRTREFAADAGAAELSADPEALISALARLDRGYRPPTPFDWLRLVRTHPDTAERIERLRQLAPPADPRILIPGLFVLRLHR